MTILNIVDCFQRVHNVETAKYNTHDKRNVIMTDDLHVPVKGNKCSALVQYIQVLCMNITKTKHNNVIYYCIMSIECD